MQNVISLATIVFTVLLGAMSPGPSFLMVARVSVSQSRRQGIEAAFGMGVASVLLFLLAVLGLRTVFATSPRLYLALQVCGGAYLSYVGIHIWRSGKEPIADENTKPDGHARGHGEFGKGFMIQLSNPKTIVFFSSIFASTLPSDIHAGLIAALLVLVFIVETGWYVLVATLLSTKGPRAAYMRARVFIDRVAGSLILFLGLKLIAAAF